jgi:hypothetical protein
MLKTQVPDRIQSRRKSLRARSTQCVRRLICDRLPAFRLVRGFITHLITRKRPNSSTRFMEAQIVQLNRARGRYLWSLALVRMTIARLRNQVFALEHRYAGTIGRTIRLDLVLIFHLRKQLRGRSLGSVRESARRWLGGTIAQDRERMTGRKPST